MVNVTMSSPIYANSIIDVFHARIASVLRQATLWRLTLGFPMLPLCEQPMNPTLPVGRCFKSKCKFYKIIF
jgi:hypothetical protein